MSGSVAAKEALRALRSVVAALPDAEERPGQEEMSSSIAESLASGRSIIVQAGTGTGKSLGYLVPALTSGKKTVVATATKALQDQLDRNDLPFLARTLGIDFTWAVVKGRSNYVCVQRLKETKEAPDQLEFEDSAPSVRREVDAIRTWAVTTTTGDLEELTRAPSERVRKLVAVGVDECPGRNKCPSGADCWAEKARSRAESADVVVVNLHLYGLHVASGGAILPEHEVVVFDEVHQLETVMSNATGIELSGGRFMAAAAAVRSVIADNGVTSPLENAGSRFAAAIGPFAEQRFTEAMPASVTEPLSQARIEINVCLDALRNVKTDNEATTQKSLRAQTQLSRLAESVDLALGTHEGFVAYVSGPEDRPSLQIKPLDVGPVLQKQVWSSHASVLTSATVPLSLPERVGLDADSTEELVVNSPFDYERNAVLYCSPDFPGPGSREHRAFVHDELETLITAAGGRTLALFTSLAAMDAAAADLRARLPFPIHTQRDLSRQALIDEFMNDEHTCIFASQTFFQGVDLPGRTLSLVVLDKLPFPRPDDPLLEAKRDAVGRKESFKRIDLPICATSLAQAAGRLIRTGSDKGVVAVLDSRLASAKYRWTLLNVLPPMRRTRDRDEVLAFLREITGQEAQ